ncbi:hypothetical protein AZ54_11340 [Xanthomonas oryzae pv. oryzae PXO86]|nr:hypothetical protein AZ54_11340 [Xanthomonas oryzae pv. oryzae PXO86]
MQRIFMASSAQSEEDSMLIARVGEGLRRWDGG